MATKITGVVRGQRAGAIPRHCLCLQRTSYSQFQGQSPTHSVSLQASRSKFFGEQINEAWFPCVTKVPLSIVRPLRLKITSQKSSLWQNRQDRHELPKRPQLGIRWGNLLQSFPSQAAAAPSPAKFFLVAGMGMRVKGRWSWHISDPKAGVTKITLQEFRQS